MNALTFAAGHTVSFIAGNASYPPGSPVRLVPASLGKGSTVDGDDLRSICSNQPQPALEILDVDDIASLVCLSDGVEGCQPLATEEKK
jgi:hypothetical protein